MNVPKEARLTPIEKDKALKPYMMKRRLCAECGTEYDCSPWYLLSRDEREGVIADAASEKAYKESAKELLKWLKDYAIHGGTIPLVTVLEDIRVHSKWGFILKELEVE